MEGDTTWNPIRELIAVDLEMTGLQVKTDRILEIGAVRLVERIMLRDTFQTFVNSASAGLMHGLRN